MRAAVLVEYNNEEIKITIATNLQRNPIWWIILDVFAYAKKKGVYLLQRYSFGVRNPSDVKMLSFTLEPGQMNTMEACNTSIRIKSRVFNVYIRDLRGFYE